MGWRIVQITKPCRLSVKDRQLLYTPSDGDELKIPLEDISVLVLENKQISLNSYLLSELSEFDIVVFVCDNTHLPSGALFPFLNHSRYAEISWLQIEMSEPLKKRIWQEIIKSKITNQAECLKIFNRSNAQKLREIAKMVQSGDSKNTEAFAAGIYWKSLFDKFNRHDDNDIRNAALNYGYAIIRGCMARAIVGAGLLPCFGVHHANKLNQFNLADDMIEPLRPFVDYQVNMLNLEGVSELNTSIKNDLLKILTQNCIMANEEINLLKSCELMAVSLVKSIKNKDVKFMELPKLKKIPLFE